MYMSVTAERGLRESPSPENGSHAPEPCSWSFRAKTADACSYYARLDDAGVASAAWAPEVTSADCLPSSSRGWI